MAKTDALSILESAEVKDKLAEKDGELIDSIQKDALSSRLKNTNYSGDPSTGSVVINRFMNSSSNDYGTARAAGEGAKLKNNGKVTINIDTDKEIVEEIEGKDITRHRHIKTKPSATRASNQVRDRMLSPPVLRPRRRTCLPEIISQSE